MEQSLNLSDTKRGRIELVDALRGFALFAIVLLHNLEHYNIFGTGAWEPGWLQMLDEYISEFIFFAFAGKAYATFSLLFGLSFYIQMRNARKRGCDYRVRFAWRMFILFCFSQLHALFYNGDILLLYSVCGLILIPASSWKNRTVLIVAAILMLQPYCWAKIIYSAFIDHNYIDSNDLFMPFAISAGEVGRHGNLWQTLANNIWNGQLYSNVYQIEAGRLFQTPALFLFGMYLGRINAFENNETNRRFWRRIVGATVVCLIPLYYLSRLFPATISQQTVLAYYNVAVPMLYNFFFMAFLVALFSLLWFYIDNGAKWQRILIPYGRMSLTNYIGQSIIGVTLYYHFGLSLYDKVGSTITILIGLSIITVQIVFSNIWLAKHRQGPLEYVWKRLTWLNVNNRLSKTQTI